MFLVLRLKRKRNEKIICCFLDGGVLLLINIRGIGKDIKIEKIFLDFVLKFGNILVGM